MILTPPAQWKWWVPYLLFTLLVLFLLWKLAPVGLVKLLDRLSPLHIGTPRISGTVVDAVTGKPVPGMDVCLLVTYIRANFDHREGPTVMRSLLTQTDASGKFFFERWDDQRDFLDDWDGYGIALTDPAARWKEKCGQEIYLLGQDDIFEREVHLEKDSYPVTQSPPPYFPVALVNDLLIPKPQAYGMGVFFGHFPDGSLVRKISDPGNLKIAAVPLLRDQNECRSARDSDFAELCRVMNESPTADDLRKAWKLSPTGGRQ